MTTPERTVEEIVDEIMKNFDNEIKDFPREFVAKVFTEALQAERKKREEILNKWNSLYGDAVNYKAEEVLAEFNVYIQTLSK